MISVTTDVGVFRTGMLNELKTANGENVPGGARGGLLNRESCSGKLLNR